MITIDECVAGTLLGMKKANKQFNDWSGYWITDYGAEFYLVSKIAEEIMRHGKNDPAAPQVYFEVKFKEIVDYKGERFRGRPPKAGKGGNRLDLALYSNDKLKYAIEVKRSASVPSCNADLKRVAHLVKKGYAQFGIFAGLWFKDYSIEKKSQLDVKARFYNLLEKHLNKLHSTFLHRELTDLRFQFDKKLYMEWSDDKRLRMVIPYVLYFGKAYNKE